MAQSQSRISFLQPTQADTEEASRNPLERPRVRHPGPSRFATSRPYLQRPSLGNPYQATASHLSQFPFASRTSTAQAPLFHSATDDFREEDDEVEREREAADFYALQRSRRQFGTTHLEESSETEEERSRTSEPDGDGRDVEERGFRRGGGIRSSWRGGRASGRGRHPHVDMVGEETDGSESNDRRDSETSSKGKGRMVDIGLDSVLHEGPDLDEHDDAVSARA